MIKPLILALGFWTALAMHPMHFRPPAIADGLSMTSSDGLVFLTEPEQWPQRVEGWFPRGSSARWLNEELGRQGFLLRHGRDVLRGVPTGRAYYIWRGNWRRDETCVQWLSLDWSEDGRGRVARTSAESRSVCPSPL